MNQLLLTHEQLAGIRVKRPCILMFSGGRDSSLAAIRLHERGHNLVLVTVISDHLFGISAVRSRLRELSRMLPIDTPWLLIRQPSELSTDTSFYSKTCLPCHHAYVVVAMAVAVYLSAPHLAFGYAGYQDSWPEQTPVAVERIKALLQRHGVDLLLPVYDLHSRDEVLIELGARGLSLEALEQKCIQQVTNIKLSPEQLEQQVALWEAAIDESVSHLHSIPMNVQEFASLAEV